MGKSFSCRTTAACAIVAMTENSNALILRGKITFWLVTEEPMEPMGYRVAEVEALGRPLVSWIEAGWCRVPDGLGKPLYEAPEGPSDRLGVGGGSEKVRRYDFRTRRRSDLATT